MADDRQELSDKTHEGFKITCLSCGGSVVIIESDVGMSAMSGAWGGVSLVCCDCRAETRYGARNPHDRQ